MRRVSSASLFALATLAALTALTGSSRANPRPLPFTYQYQTLPCGGFEIEQYLDAVPVRILKTNGDKSFAFAYQMQTEFELGLSPRLELGVYLVWAQDAGTEVNPPLTFRGTKQRLRYRFAEAGEWPVDLGVYFEAVELRDEFELEQKIILEKRFGKLRAIANITTEQEYEWLTEAELEFIFAPSAGLIYEVSPKATLGVEYWANSYDGFKHYAGPTAMFQSGDVWLTLGVYLRADDPRPEVGDPYGGVWVRALGGLGF